MNSKRRIFIALPLLVLLPVLGRLFLWSKPDRSIPATLAAPAPAPKAAEPPKPVKVAVVEAPKITPVTPMDVSEITPVAADAKAAAMMQANARLDQVRMDLAMRRAGNSPPAMGLGPVSTQVADLGEVYLTNGTTQQVIASDGTPVTITGTQTPDGLVQLRIQIDQRSPNGDSTGRSTMTITAKQGQSVTLGGMRSTAMVNGQAQTTQTTLKITPHVN